MENLTRLEGKSKQGTLSAAVQRACGMLESVSNVAGQEALPSPQMHLHFSGC